MYTATNEPPTVKVVGAFAAVYFIWGSTYLAIRFAIETMPPFLMAGARFLVAGAVLYPWLRLRGWPAPTAAHWRATAIGGILMLLVGNGSVVWAEQRVPSGLTALLLATMPLWMVLLEWLLFGGSRPAIFPSVFLLTGFAGAFLLVEIDRGAHADAVDPVGAAALLLASFSWALGSLYSRSAELPPSALLAGAMQMLVAGALFVIVGIAAGEMPRLTIEGLSARSVLALGYLVVFGSIVGFSSYGWLLRVSEPARVSTYAYVNPVVAVLLGWLLGGEAFTPRVGVATAIIVASVAAIITYRSVTRSAPPPLRTLAE